MARTFPTDGLAPIDAYVVDEGGRCAGHFIRAVVGTVSNYGPTLQAEVDIKATGTIGTHATAIRAIVSEALGGTMSSDIAPLSIETYIADAPTGTHAMIRFNTNAAGDTPDVLFTGNIQSVAYTASATTTTVAGTIRVMLKGGNLTNTYGRIRVYQDA